MVVISSKETEISALEKDISDRGQIHESIVSERDGTIASLREKISQLKTEASDSRESCRLAEESAARLTLQLQATEAVVTELRVEVDVSKAKLGVLEMSNSNLLRDQETSKLDLEQAKAERIKTENTAEDVRNHAQAVSDELRSLKILQDEQISKIEDLVDSLSRTSNDAQTLRESSKVLEASVAAYEAEIKRKDKIRENLEIQVKESDSRIAQLSADLQAGKKSVEDVKTRLADANKRAVDAELVNEELKTELSLRDGAVQQYQNDLVTVEEQLQLKVTDWTAKHANDTMALSSTISDLRYALVTANGDVERLNLRLRAVEDERLSIQQELGRKGADLLETLNSLEMERNMKLAFEGDLLACINKNQELEEEIGFFKTSKEADEVTISSLQTSFMKFRESQLQIFGEFELEVY